MSAVKQIPATIYDQFTMGQIVPVESRFIDESDTGGGYVWTQDRIKKTIAKACRRENMGYGRTTPLLYEALDKYPVAHNEVLVVGSKAPTYECILHVYDAVPVTVDYKPIDTEFCDTYSDWGAVPVCEAALSVSSIEHSGLGRYGDALDPDGDIKAMQDIRRKVAPGGLLFLAVPVGADTLVWNAHRIYGPKRLPMLTAGWKRVDSFGLERLGNAYKPAQPVIVLQNQK